MQSAVPQVLEVLDRRHRPGRPEACRRRGARGRLRARQPRPDLRRAARDRRRLADLARRRDRRRARSHQRVRAGRRAGHRARPPGRRRASCPRPTTTCMADRYVMADETLRAAGYDWYEVSNWARTADAADAGTTSCTGRTRTGGASAPARTATSAACAGGTSSTRRATPRCSRPARARPPAARPSTRRRGTPSG